MRRFWHGMLTASLLTFALTTSAQGAAEVGSSAPDFCLPSSQGEKVCLKDFKGKDNVVLLFYVLDFTPG